MGLGKTYSTQYLLDSNNNSGVAGQVLSTTSTGIDWVDANTVPGAGLWLENSNDIYNSNSGNVGIGVTSPSTKLEVLASQSNSSIRAGGLEMQSYAVNNSWYAENLYYNAGWKLRSNGYATQMYMQGGKITFNRFASGNAGDFVTPYPTMILDSNGNVGIGTTSPTGKFNSYISATRQLTHNGNGGDLSIISDNNSSPVMFIKGTGSADLLNVFDNTTEVFTILDGGNVGIGTATPGTFLQLGSYPVSGTYVNNATYPDVPSEHMIHLTAPSTTGYFGGGISFGENAFTAANITAVDAGGGGALHLAFGTGNSSGMTERVRIANNGNVGIGTAAPFTGITLGSTGSFGFEETATVNPDPRRWWINTDQIVYGDFRIATASAKQATTPDLTRLYINPSGNVGIGTTTPIGKLTVQGDDADIFLRSNDYTIARIINRGSTHPNLDIGIFSLYNANAENVRLDGGGTSWLNGGNVGIGTTSPSAKLDVAGDLRIDGYSTTTNEAGLYLFNNIAYSMASLANCNNSYNAFRIRGRNSATNTLGIGSNGNSDYVLQVVNDAGTVSGNISLNPYGGNVGIGTASPIDKLNVDGGTGDTSTQDSKLALTRTSSTGNVLAGKMVLKHKTTNFGNLVFQVKTTASSAENSAYYTDAITIDGQNANVGIGTTSPGSKLEINENSTGTVYSKVFNQNAGVSATARMAVVAESAQLDIIATSAGYTGVSGWADSGVISTDSSASGGLILNAQTGGLKLQTAASTKMVVLASGSVGIGTTSPLSKLTIDAPVGNFANGTNAISLNYDGGSSPGDVGGGIVFSQKWWSASAGQQVTGGIFGIKHAGNGSYGGGLGFYTQPNGASNMAQHMVIRSTGEVGIGTTDPGQKLSIFAGTNESVYDVLGVYNSVTGTTAQNKGAAIRIGKDIDGNYSTKIATIYEGNNPSFLQPALAFYTMHNTYLKDSETEKMRISSNGNVGIGFTSPGSTPLSSMKLSVNGNGYFAGNVGIGTTEPEDKLEVSGGALKIKANASATLSPSIKLGRSDQANGNYENHISSQTGSGASQCKIEFKVCNTTATGRTTLLSLDGGNNRSIFQGNVGIGYTSPGSQLSIYKTAFGGDTAGSGGTLDFGVGSTKYWQFRLDSSSSGDLAIDKTYASVWTTPVTIQRSSGNVGIGTDSPECKLHVVSTTTDNTKTVLIQNSSTGDASIMFNISGDTYSLGIDNSDGDKFKLSYGALGTNDMLVIDSSGNATFAGDVVAFSDIKLKENIKTLDGSKVYNMRGVSFTRKDNGNESSGVIAQEIQKIAPELVNETDGTLGVAYGNLTGYLIEAIKELKAEIEELKKHSCDCKK